MPVKPISPKEARIKKQAAIPDFVIEAFNKLIVENMSVSGTATIQQDAVMDLIMAHSKLETPLAPEAFTRQDVYSRRWLDVEDLYRKQGWNVKYDKPGYNESYNAFFEFSSRG